VGLSTAPEALQNPARRAEQPGDRLSRPAFVVPQAIADKPWDLTVWLEHNATPLDADIVIEARGQVIGTFAKLIRHHEHGEPDPCPRCES
jgi:hypothetical protein